MVAMGPLGGVKGGGGGGASGMGAKFVEASNKVSVSPDSSCVWKSADRGEGSNGSNGDFGVVVLVWEESIFVD